MSISDIANSIQADLQTWAEPKGGTAAIVSNMDMLWKQAFMASDKPRILICYEGEVIRGEFGVAAALHRVDRDWVVVITRGRGFNAERGDSLSQTRQNAEPFYDSVETVRDMIRALLGISEEIPVDYKNIEPMSMGEQIVDGYMIRFSTANDLPGLSPNPDSLANPQSPPPSGQP